MSTKLPIAIAVAMLFVGCAPSSWHTEPLPGPWEPQTGTGTSLAPTSQPPTRLMSTQPKLLPGTAHPIVSADQLPDLPQQTPTETFNIRLEGDDTQSADAFLVRVRRLRAIADRHVLPVTIEHDAVDLAYEGNAWLIGTVKVPKQAKKVHFLLELDDFGAFESTSNGAGVDTHALPISWTSEVDWLRHRGHTVVHLDVARSLVPQNDGLRLVPQLQILH